MVTEELLKVTGVRNIYSWENCCRQVIPLTRLGDFYRLARRIFANGDPQDVADDQEFDFLQLRKPGNEDYHSLTSLHPRNIWN